MNQRSKRFSQTDFEMKSKLQKLDFIRNATNAMITQSDLLPKTKPKTTNQRKSINSIAKKRTLPPMSRLSIQKNLSTDKSILNVKSHNPTAQVNMKFH